MAEDLTANPSKEFIVNFLKGSLTNHVVETQLDPRKFQPELPLPSGYSKARILESLCTVSIDGSATGELLGYATADCERFLHTLALVPEGQGELLEIGSNPYFTSLLLRRFRSGYRMSLTNFFGGIAGEAMQQVRMQGFDGTAEECDFVFHSLT